MPKIIVNPEDLERKAREIDRLSERLSKLTGRISSVCLLAGSYDGQFKPRVVQLAGHMNSKIMQSSSRASRSGQKLSAINKKFIEADLQTTDFFQSFKSKSFEEWSDWLKEKVKNGWGEAIKKALPFLGTGALFSQGATKIDAFRFTVIERMMMPKPLTDEEADNLVLIELKKFSDHNAGKEMIEAAIKAGVLFVFVNHKGETVYSIGDAETARKTIPISFKDTEGCEGYFSDLNKTITLNKNSNNNYRLYKHAIIHEMQHAIDCRYSEGDNFFSENANPNESNYVKGNFSSLTSEDKVAIEVYYSNEVHKRLKTEVNAHDIGYEYEGGFYEKLYGKILDRSDGIYSKNEFNIILYPRLYRRQYINEYEQQLKAAFNDGSDYSIKIRLLENGQPKVSIVKRKKFIFF